MDQRRSEARRGSLPLSGCPWSSGRSCATSGRRPRRVGAARPGRDRVRAGLLRAARSRSRGTTTRSSPSPGSSPTPAIPTRSRSTASGCGRRASRRYPPSVAAHPRPRVRPPAPDHLRLVPLREGRRPQARGPPRHRRARRLRRPHDRAAAAARSGPTRCCCSATRSTPTSSRRRTAAASPGAATGTRTGPTTRSSASTSTSASTATRGADPEVRWLLSCVPTAMIFDDHDVRDDWNTSAVWRQQMAREAVVARADPVGAGVVLGLPAPGQPPGRGAAPPTPTTAEVLDGRGRHLAAAGRARRPGRRRGRRGEGRAVQLPLGPRHQPLRDDRLPERADPRRRPRTSCSATREFGWVEEQVRDRRRRPPRARHLAAVAAAPRHRRPAEPSTRSPRPGPAGAAGSGETIRQAGDLEHWQAFRDVVRPAHPADRSGPRPATRERRRRRSACSPATSTTATPPGSTCPAPATTRRAVPPPSTSSPARPCTTSSTGSSGPRSGSAGRARSRARPGWWAGRAGVPPSR